MYSVLRFLYACNYNNFNNIINLSSKLLNRFQYVIK